MQAGKGAGSRPSIRDVAQLAGVSPACVSNVLNRRRSQTDDIGRAVMLAVETLGYRANPIAAGLRRTISRFIGVVIPDFENPFFGQLVAELERCAEASDFRIVAASSREDAEVEAREVAEFLDLRVAGLLIAPAADGLPRERPDTGDVPIVVVDRLTGWPDVDEVGVNNREISREVVLRLIAEGHEELLVAFSTEATTNMGERLDGVREAAATAGIRLIEVRCGPSIASSDAALEEEFARGFLPSAIFALNNLAALAALGAVQRRGLELGSDVAVVSFDDSAWMAHVHPRIAAVVQPVPDIAREAWECLMARVRGEGGPSRQISLPCRLEGRDTFGTEETRARA